MGQDFVGQSTGVFPAPSSEVQDLWPDDCIADLENYQSNLTYAVNEPTNRDTSAIDNNQTSYPVSGPIPPSDPLPVTDAINPNGRTENNLTSYRQPATSSPSKKAKIKYGVKAIYKRYPCNKFDITSTTKVEEIKRKAGEPFKLEEDSLIMSYMDEDGDIIGLWTQQNLKDALKNARPSNGVKKTVVLTITRFDDYAVST